MNTSTDPKVIVALDFSSVQETLSFVDRLQQGSCRLKVGKELFTHAGPSLVEQLVGKGFDVFLDLKFHDIPNTVARACAVAADLGVWMMNVHASGGRKMMEMAREALEQKGGTRPLLIAVTILTSLDQSDLQEIGFSGDAEENVMRLAQLAESSGLDGVVCSPREVEALRNKLGQDFVLVTPGIRPADASVGDQNAS